MSIGINHRDFIVVCYTDYPSKALLIKVQTYLDQYLCHLSSCYNGELAFLTADAHLHFLCPHRNLLILTFVASTFSPFQT
jgi:hypothetical protein